MNYNTSISYHNRKEGFAPKPIQLFNINEQYVKVFTLILATACASLVFFLQSL